MINNNCNLTPNLNPDMYDKLKAKAKFVIFDKLTGVESNVKKEIINNYKGRRDVDEEIAVDGYNE